MIYSLAFFRHHRSGYESTDAGSSQGIFFVQYLPATLRAFYALYPDAQLWIHHDDRVQAFPYFQVLRSLADRGKLTLIDCGPAPALCEAMLWRLKPVWETDEIVVCRDVDSLPMPRERLMLEDFDASKRSVHAILDSESHTGPLMGGMIAVRGWRPTATWEDFIRGHALNTHGDDQRCLNEWWRQTQPDTLIHQRREVAMHPVNPFTQPVVTVPVAEKTVPADHLVYHLGAAYPIEPVLATYPNPELDELEAQCVSA